MAFRLKPEEVNETSAREPKQSTCSHETWRPERLEDDEKQIT